MATGFWEYKLKTVDDGESRMLCLGERSKGTFLPSAHTIPSTQISGALRDALGIQDIWAIGYLEEYEPVFFTYGPQDLVRGVSKIPLTIEGLTRVTGRVFIAADCGPLDSTITIALGGFRSKGFGKCVLNHNGRAPDMNIVEGVLRSRLPETEKKRIGIAGDGVIKPIYGYLFKPDTSPNPRRPYSIRGQYHRALLEGSIVRGYEFILERR